MSETKNRSLSAESDLSLAYDLFYKGEYKNCLRVIKQKLKKLKSSIDKAYFNILKLRVLQKIKQVKEKNELLTEMIAEFKTNKDLYSDDTVCKYFKETLRFLGEEKNAQEIFEIQLKNKNLSNLNDKQRNEVFKELTLGLQFKDIYSKCNLFLKQNKDDKFLTLLKHEAVFYLYKDKKLPEGMTKKIYTDLIKNIDLYRNEPGYFDIVAQFSKLFNDEETFESVLIKQRKDNEITHVQLEDIELDKLFEKKQYDDIINKLYLKITKNPEKCLFNDYERIINLIFYYCVENQLKLNISKIIKSIKPDISENLPKLNNNKVEELIVIIMNTFEYIKNEEGKKIINSFKSCILGQLMICHNLIKLNIIYNNEIEIYIKNLIVELLDRAIHKQSILFEISKYFIYLNEDNRNEIINKYKVVEIEESTFNNISKENIDNYIFYLKLDKMLLRINDSEKIKTKIINLIKCYLHVLNITKNIKLEKGERNIGDDLVILANEYFYENSDLKNNDNNLLNIILCINNFAHIKSPYNYDINYYLTYIFGFLLLNNEALDIINYMNLKGPQYESVSYFLFQFFKNFNQGMNYLVINNEKWQNENRTNSKKTLWKMLQSGNFWKTEEILDFIEQNTNSYYNYLLEFYDIILGLNDSLYGKEGRDEEKELNHYDVLNKFYINIKNLIENNKLIKNQDMFIILHKYDPNNYVYFNNNFEYLNTNINYSSNNFRYIIDSINKNNNYLYTYYPSYKNNYFKHPNLSPFKEYDNMKFLLMRNLTFILIQKLKNSKKKIDTDLKELFEYYKNLVIEINNEIDINLCSLIEIYINSFDNINYMLDNKDKMLNSFEFFKKEVIDNLNCYTQNLKYNDYNNLKLLNDTLILNKQFYFIFYSNIASILQDIISDHKKESNDISNLKTKINEIYKFPLINCLKDIQSKIDELLSKKNDENNFWNYDADINNYLDDIELKDEIISEFKRISGQIHVRHTELIDSLKFSSKKIIDYIKELI